MGGQLMSGNLQGLFSLGYFGSVVGIILLVTGAWHSLSLRPQRAPAMLCIGHAWMAGMGWHAMSLRIHVRARGDTLFYGEPEFWAMVGATALAVGCFGCSLYLVYRASPVTRPEP